MDHVTLVGAVAIGTDNDENLKSVVRLLRDLMRAVDVHPGIAVDALLATAASIIYEMAPPEVQEKLIVSASISLLEHYNAIKEGGQKTQQKDKETPPNVSSFSSAVH